MYLYFPFKETLCSDELGVYITYGIKVTDGKGGEILSVSDVSADERFVSELCRKCVLFQLDPIHLHDLIDDSI